MVEPIHKDETATAPHELFGCLMKKIDLARMDEGQPSRPGSQTRRDEGKTVCRDWYFAVTNFTARFMTMPRTTIPMQRHAQEQRTGQFLILEGVVYSG